MFDGTFGGRKTVLGTLLPGRNVFGTLGGRNAVFGCPGRGLNHVWTHRRVWRDGCPVWRRTEAGIQHTSAEMHVRMRGDNIRPHARHRRWPAVLRRRVGVRMRSRGTTGRYDGTAVGRWNDGIGRAAGPGRIACGAGRAGRTATDAAYSCPAGRNLAPRRDSRERDYYKCERLGLWRACYWSFPFGAVSPLVCRTILISEMLGCT